MTQFESLLIQNLCGVCKLTKRQIRLLADHYELLLQWNRRMNLTSLRHPEEIVIRHYCESLLLGTVLPSGPLRIIDLGSGAGFPGFPVAVLRPDCAVTLLEAQSRKCVFLRESSRELPNVSVVEQRMETVKSHFNWATSRAVSWKSLKTQLPRLADNVALLIGESDAERIRGEAGFLWSEPILLQWGDRRVILKGSVSRETS